jgi:hypothetical protein
MITQKNKGTQHFTIVAKVKPGRGKNLRAKAAERAKIPWEEADKLLRPLTLHYARWLLVDNDDSYTTLRSIRT